MFSDARASDLTFSLSSGGVLGGTFSSCLSLASLFGPGPLWVDSFSVLYRRGPTVFTIGDVSEALTDLLGLSFRGVDVDVTAKETGSTSSLATRPARPAPVGTVLGLRAVNLGFAYLGKRGTTSEGEAWSFTASCEPLAGWSLRAEGGLGSAPGEALRSPPLCRKKDGKDAVPDLTLLAVGLSEQMPVSVYIVSTSCRLTSEMTEAIYDENYSPSTVKYVESPAASSPPTLLKGNVCFATQDREARASSRLDKAREMCYTGIRCRVKRLCLA